MESELLSVLAVDEVLRVGKREENKFAFSFFSAFRLLVFGLNRAD
jgi:hypothetical protein